MGCSSSMSLIFFILVIKKSAKSFAVFVFDADGGKGFSSKDPVMLLKVLYSFLTSVPHSMIRLLVISCLLFLSSLLYESCSVLNASY